MIAEEPPPFASLLSRFRVAVGLTQEELAERAGLSARAISDLERGVKTRPRAYTIHRLADALQLAPTDRAIFEQAALAAGAAPRADDGPSEGSFLGAVPARPLVARQEERERIRALLQATAEGAGRLLLLHGELGVGKTRLAQELMIEARVRGYLVTTGRCYAAEQATPCYPFLEALGGLAADAPASVRTEVQQRWTRVQHLVSGIPREDATQAGSAVEQQQIAGIVHDLLLLVAQTIPLSLLLDDLHWADRASLRLLQHLARTMRGARILLAGTFRDTRLAEEHPELARLLQDLTREGVVERVALRRLSLEETADLVGGAMGQQEVSEEFAAFVQRRTKGNPRLIDQLVRSLGGRLALQGEIGAGAMGRVFRARDRATGELVAAKLVLARAEIPLDTQLRFQQEGAVLAALAHPNIVRVHDTFMEEHASCIIMELLDGQSLGQILCDGPLPLPRGKNLALQVAAALAYAHGQGIVHRDIKPDNVMVVGEDQVKVTDFGIARLLQPDASPQTIATTGMRLGTPLYMAPEQIEGKKVDGRTDIYAFGALLFHMVTGRPPFEGDALAVAIKHLQEEAPKPSALNPAVPADWDALIGKALAKDPARRFQSAKELQQGVGALGEEARAPDRKGVHTTAAGVSRLLPCPRWLAATVGLLALIAAAAAAWAVHTSSTSPPAATAPRLSALGAGIDSYLAGLGARGTFSGAVLVARQGTVLLSKGYGMADREHQVRNTPETKYPVGGVNSALPIQATLRLEEQGKLSDRAPICDYLQHCPAAWKPITVHMVLDGTSQIPAYSWGRAGHTTAQSVSALQAEPLDGTPGTSIDYSNGDTLVLASIVERVTGEPWATFLQHTIFGPAGMTRSGRMTDDFLPPARARDYSGRDVISSVAYNDYYAVYATAADVYAYDNAFFGGKLVSHQTLQRMLTPREPVPTNNPGGTSAAVPAAPGGVADARLGYLWQIGQLFEQQVIYTIRSLNSFTTANLRFPQSGVTIVVISNDAQNDLETVAVHIAALAFGRTPVAPARAVVATFKLQGVVMFPFALTPGALWFPTQSPHGYMGTVTRLDTQTGRVVATINVSAANVPKPEAGEGAVAAAGGQVWAVDSAAQRLVRIDPATNKVAATIHLGIPAAGLAIAGDTLWATADPGLGDNIARVDLRIQKVVAVIAHAGHPFIESVATPDALWYISQDSGQVVRLDAATNRVVASIAAGPVPQTVFMGAGSVWVGDASGAEVSRINPRTNRVVASIKTEGYPGNRQPFIDNCACRYAADDSAVWVIANSTTLLRIDPRTNRPVASLTLDSNIGSIGLSEGSVWVATNGGEPPPHTIYRVDPQAMQ